MPHLALPRSGVLLACGVALGIHLAGRPALRPLRGPVLGYLGQVSYGLYLYHLVVLRLLGELRPRLGLGGDLLAAIGVGLSVLLAALSWRFIERPILAHKERFRYRAAAPARAGRRGDAAHAAPRPGLPVARASAASPERAS